MRRARSSSRFLACLLALACMATGVAAQAQDGRDPPQRGERSQRPEEGRGQHHSLSDSVRRVRSETRGQVLSAERVQFDGRDINRIKYVDEHGRVRTMDDAGSSRRRGFDSPVRPRRDIPSPQPARGDNPPRP